MSTSSTKTYALYCDRVGKWNKEFEFHASDIKEAKSLSYAWAVKEGIGQNRVGVKEVIDRKPFLTIVCREHLTIGVA